MATIQKKYTFAVIATDVVLLTLDNGILKTLLIKMKKSPYEDCWATPGGLVKPFESVDESAERILAKETGLKGIYLEQLYTFGKVHRDPFGRVVSVAYTALLSDPTLHLNSDGDHDVDWFDVRKLPKLAYDHADIIAMAVSRLKGKLEYTNIVYTLLPKEFTLSELQSVYETIIGRQLDKRNFRKKILALNLLKPLAKRRSGSANRPAQLYRFSKTTLQQIMIL